MKFFVTAPRRLEEVLANELAEHGLQVEPARSGVWVVGGLEAAYRVCLWSRVANRVLWPIARFEAKDADGLYRGALDVDWSEHLDEGRTFAVRVVLVRSSMGHSRFAALRVKDAIVDRLREERGSRPNVDTQRPDVQVSCFVFGADAQISIDLSGDSLHRRGYRSRTAEAPLKENLAAALLRLAGWPDALRAGRPFFDPMCGSGTLPVEAALMALDVAPGLLRERVGAEGWARHEPAVWAALVDEARARDRRGAADLPVIAGCDADARAVAIARDNAARAGVAGHVELEVGDIAGWEPPAGSDGGLMLVNPPYGQRLSEVDQLRPLYRTMGDVFKQRFGGWSACVLSGSRDLDGEVGLRPSRRVPVFNGPIECRLLVFPITGRTEPAPVEAIVEASPVEPGQVDAFANRLSKRARHLGRWAARRGIACYRVYDADIPIFNAAIDVYRVYDLHEPDEPADGAGRIAAHVQEYAAPRGVDDALASARRRAMIAAIPDLLEVDPADVHLKVRRRQRGKAQYQKLRDLGRYLKVPEGGHWFLVNLTDYLDTGLFLDHRDTRAHLAKLAAGRSFLNLFAYTGTATVYAVGGGATWSVTVDRSRTYLEWAEANFQLNGLDPQRHELVRADCLEWVKDHRGRYGLIFLDPPTFSNTKSKAGSWDVQRDHAWLIRSVARLLEDDGVLVFSTNSRRFELDVAGLSGLQVNELGGPSVPLDFERTPDIHHVWEIRRR